MKSQSKNQDKGKKKTPIPSFLQMVCRLVHMQECQDTTPAHYHSVDLQTASHVSMHNVQIAQKNYNRLQQHNEIII